MAPARELRFLDSGLRLRTPDSGLFHLPPPNLIHDCPIRRQQLDLQGHVSQGVGGTTQAGVKSAHDGFHAVQHPFRKLLAIYEMLRHLQNAAIERQIVMPGGDDEIGPDHQPIFIHLVVVDQGAAWGLCDADALRIINPGKSPDVLGKDIRAPGATAPYARCHK